MDTKTRYKVLTIVDGKRTKRSRTFGSMTEAEEYMRQNRFDADYTFLVTEIVTTTKDLGIF